MPHRPPIIRPDKMKPGAPGLVPETGDCTIPLRAKSERLPHRRCRPLHAMHGEEGYLLVGVIFLMALLILSLSIAIPRVRQDIQRQRDIETMHRGKQYIRAIQLYYRKFGAYPPNIDALIKTNEIRFLRKRYKDPITGKDDWKPIMFGQNKTPTAMGYFGEPLATGSTLAGTGPSGGNGLTGGSTLGNSGSLFNSGSSDSSGSTSTTTPTTGTGTGTNSSDGSSNGTSTTSTTGTSSGSDDSSAFGSTNGKTFGGAGIIGFEPASPKQSILLYKKKNHYNEWEFTYDPQQDRQTISSNTGTLNSSSDSTSSNSSSNSTSTTTPQTPATPTPQQ